MARRTNRRARIGVEDLEGKQLLSTGNLLTAAGPQPVVQTASVPNIVGDRFAVTDGIYDYVGTLYITSENTTTGRLSGLYIDRQLNHLGVVQTVSGQLTKDVDFYKFSFSGSGFIITKTSPFFLYESQTVTFGGSLDLSNFSLPMVGIMDVHDDWTFGSSDTGQIAVGGRIPKPVPDVSGQVFTMDDASFHHIGKLVITSEDQSSDTFTGYYTDTMHNELGVVQTVHGVIVPNPDRHGPIGFQFAGSGNATGGVFPFYTYEHQSVTFEGTIEGSGYSATITGTLDLRDHYYGLLFDTHYDSGPIQAIGLS
jgi:hypothetical protein